MAFDFRKYIPTSFKYPKGPDANFKRVNVNQTRYKELLKEFKEGKVDKLRIERFEQKWMEKEEDRERRWEMEFKHNELKDNLLKDYNHFKENGKQFIQKCLDLGSKGMGMFSKWWMFKPKKPCGKGELKQSPITGKWSQEYKPNKSRRLKDWLQAAESGDAFTGSLNKNRIKLNRLPTEEEKGIAAEARRMRQLQKWRWFLKETNYMGKTDPIVRQDMWNNPDHRIEY